MNKTAVSKAAEHALYFNFLERKHCRDNCCRAGAGKGKQSALGTIALLVSVPRDR
jgi:hypothetical protein